MREPRIWPYPVIFAGTVLAMIGFMVWVFTLTRDAASHSDGGACTGHVTLAAGRTGMRPAGGDPDECRESRRAGTRAVPDQVVQLFGRPEAAAAMKTALLVILPPVFITMFCYTVIWAVEPDYLRQRAGVVLPLLFGVAVAFGEFIVWLGRVSAG